MTRLQIGMIIVALILLSLRFYFYFHNQIPYKDGEKVELQTILLSEPTLSRFNQSIFLQTQKGKVRVILSRYPEYHYGDFVRISGMLQLKSITQTRGVITKEKIEPTVSFPHIDLVKNGDTLTGIPAPFQVILAIASDFRQNVISSFNNTLSSPSSALLLGIVFGIKEPMGKSFTDFLRVAGVFHVVAASGMNVTLVASFLGTCFSLFLKRRVALLLTILFILFYALVSGFQASIVRASIMGILVLTAQIMGRQTLPLYGLFIAGFSMLMLDPATLFDIGFELSFASSLGLLFIQPLFKVNKKVEFIIKRSFIGEDGITTVAAQLATLPILVTNFGSYSPVSILANALVLWTVPILMIMGGIGGIVGLAFEPFGRIFLYLCLPFLMYFEVIIEWFGIHFGSISFPEIPWQMGVGYYLLLAALIMFIKRNSKSEARNPKQIQMTKTINSNKF